MTDLLPTTNNASTPTKKIEPEKTRTLVAFALVVVAYLMNEMALAYVHDRVPRGPERGAPLPDFFFDILPEETSALHVTEWIMIFMTVNAIILAVCHQYRWIVFRRVFFCAAVSYAFRAFCITIVQVPVPSVNTYCAPQGNGSFASIANRVQKMFWSAGIEQLRPRELCGDLIVSGHTLTLFVTMMTFRQYAPRRFTYLGYFYNVLAFVALFCILLARKHYSIDLVLGYFVSTRVFWTYHALANSFHACEFDRNPLSQSWWSFFVKYFEHDAPPPHLFLNVLEWPSSCPSRIRRRLSM